jgi:hypothetical protein
VCTAGSRKQKVPTQQQSLLSSPLDSDCSGTCTWTALRARRTATTNTWGKPKAKAKTKREQEKRIRKEKKRKEKKRKEKKRKEKKRKSDRSIERKKLKSCACPQLHKVKDNCDAGTRVSLTKGKGAKKQDNSMGST